LLTEGATLAPLVALKVIEGKAPWALLTEGATLAPLIEEEIE